MKTLKRAMALIFVFMLSINSFAAIVSDNDGSAFVTKAEFEAMKQSFSKQITDYESSITSKIDGAIASYLAGININKSEILIDYLTNIKNIYEWGTYFANKDTATSYNSNNDKYTQGGLWLFRLFGWNIAASKYVTMINVTTWSQHSHSLHLIPEEASITGKRVFIKATEINGTKYYGPYLDYYTKPLQKIYVNGMVSVWNDQNKHNVSLTSFPTRTWDFTSGTTKLSAPGSVTFSAYTNTEDANITWNPNGTIIVTYNNQNAAGYKPQYSYVMQSAQGKSDSTTSIYGIDYDKRMEFDTTTGTEVTEDTRFETSNRGQQCQIFQCHTAPASGDGATDGKYTNHRWPFKFYQPKTYNFKNSTMYNYPATSVIKTPVPQYAGIPVTTISKPGKIKFKLKIQNKKAKADGTALEDSTQKCSVYFKMGQFGNCLCTADTNIIGTYTDKCNETIKVELEIPQSDISRSGILYVKAVDANATPHFIELSIDGDIAATYD